MSSTPGEHAESAPQPQRPVDPTPAELAAQQGVPARGASHYAKGTAANMVRSMVVIVVITFALYLISGRTNGTATDTVDVVGTAQHHAQQSGHPFAHPKDLPAGWAPSSVRYASSEGAMTWQAGYTTPDDEYVSVKQAADPAEEWVGVQTHGGAATGELTTDDGREWTKRATDGGGQRSLVLQPQEWDGLTTVVTGSGSWSQLEEFAERLVPASTGAKGESPA
ncbi:DUF4245 domain-containing protein [Janibacter cremeus]|uniref:DUF4245 domain-containing protein n=1 Tax=Janibacter cremeus TaxID=1285192 RepID=UPI0023F69363|nr:DUF4245 domain-containing protein [Janibacter cremeus]WEV78016.1 DUF4245 domain-containing protein [Janibacter cremeus]